MANGVASTLDLIQVPGVSEPRLMRREAARQMGALRVAFQKHFGVPLYLAETFRSLKTQQDYYRTYPKGAAAYPGTSYHGTGDAADCWTGVDRYGTPEHNWMQANAPAYGFTNTQGKATRSSRYPNGEAHHWVYVGRPTIVAGTGATPIEEQELNADDKAWMNGFGDALIGQLKAAIPPAVWGQMLENPANGNKATMAGDLLRYGEQSDVQRRDEILAGVGRAVAGFPLDRPDLPQANGKPQQTQMGDMVRYLQTWVNQLDTLIRATGGAQLTDEQIKIIAGSLSKSLPAPTVDEASIVRKVIAGVRGIFTRAGTEG